jgi:hypothetical protein
MRPNGDPSPLASLPATWLVGQGGGTRPVAGSALQSSDRNSLGTPQSRDLKSVVILIVVPRRIYPALSATAAEKAFKLLSFRGDNRGLAVTRQCAYSRCFTHALCSVESQHVSCDTWLLARLTDLLHAAKLK